MHLVTAVHYFFCYKFLQNTHSCLTSKEKKDVCQANFLKENWGNQYKMRPSAHKFKYLALIFGKKRENVHYILLCFLHQLVIESRVVKYYILHKLHEFYQSKIWLFNGIIIFYKEIGANYKGFPCFTFYQ